MELGTCGIDSLKGYLACPRSPAVLVLDEKDLWRRPCVPGFGDLDNDKKKAAGQQHVDDVGDRELGKRRHVQEAEPAGRQGEDDGDCCWGSGELRQRRRRRGRVA